MLAQCPPCSVEMAYATPFYVECVCNTRCVSRRYHMPITTRHNRVTVSPHRPHGAARVRLGAHPTIECCGVGHEPSRSLDGGMAIDRSV